MNESLRKHLRLPICWEVSLRSSLSIVRYSFNHVAITRSLIIRRQRALRVKFVILIKFIIFRLSIASLLDRIILVKWLSQLCKRRQFSNIKKKPKFQLRDYVVEQCDCIFRHRRDISGIPHPCRFIRWKVKGKDHARVLTCQLACQPAALATVFVIFVVSLDPF